MTRETFPFHLKNLDFHEPSHRYTYYDGTLPIKVMSVTQWLSTFQPKFDPYKISETVSRNKNSEYYGMDPAEIRKKWSDTAIRGSSKHNAVENYLLGITKTCPEQKLLNSLNIYLIKNGRSFFKRATGLLFTLGTCCVSNIFFS